jgi:tyrosyl-tRNA synthetase
MPILEGLDGVQKMSKSLGNAIGIQEPALEMYGKIMSISDEMMWRYYELLTDVQLPEIEKMKRETHPMEAKKDLARRIVADFHSSEAAAKAAGDWAKQFQKDEVPTSVEQVPVKFGDIEWSSNEDSATAVAGKGQLGIKLDRLLVKCGLADSATDATRKLKEGAVRVRSVEHSPHLCGRASATLVLRVGKRVKVRNKPLISVLVHLSFLPTTHFPQAQY